jgi:hypothetical protein
VATDQATLHPDFPNAKVREGRSRLPCTSRLARPSTRDADPPTLRHPGHARHPPSPWRPDLPTLHSPHGGRRRTIAPPRCWRSPCVARARRPATLRWEIEAKDGLPSADRNNKATLLLTGPFRTAKSSAKDLTPLVLKLQYAKYRGALLSPRSNRLLRR